MSLTFFSPTKVLYGCGLIEMLHIKVLMYTIIVGIHSSHGLFTARCVEPIKSGDDDGPLQCRAYIPRWGFQIESGKCIAFIYGGCGGNDNRFLTQSDCERYCDVKSIDVQPRLFRPPGRSPFDSSEESIKIYGPLDLGRSGLLILRAHYLPVKENHPSSGRSLYDSDRSYDPMMHHPLFRIPWRSADLDSNSDLNKIVSGYEIPRDKKILKFNIRSNQNRLQDLLTDVPKKTFRLFRPPWRKKNEPLRPNRYKYLYKEDYINPLDSASIESQEKSLESENPCQANSLTCDRLFRPPWRKSPVKDEEFQVAGVSRLFNNPGFIKREDDNTPFSHRLLSRLFITSPGRASNYYDNEAPLFRPPWRRDDPEDVRLFRSPQFYYDKEDKPFTLRLVSQVLKGYA